MEKLKKGFNKNPLIWTSIVVWIIIIPTEFIIDPNKNLLLNYIVDLLIGVPIYLFLIWVFILTPIKFFKTKDKKKFLLSNALLLIFILFIALVVGFFGFFSPWYYGKSAKVNATKTMHSMYYKYISAEIQKCLIGESKFMGTDQDCPATIEKAISGALNTITDKNPYKHYKFTIRKSDSNTNDEDVGYISLSALGSNIIIKSCHRTPCNEEANRQSSTVSIE